MDLGVFRSGGCSHFDRVFINCRRKYLIDKNDFKIYIHHLAEAFHSTLCTVSKGQPKNTNISTTNINNKNFAYLVTIKLVTYYKMWFLASVRRNLDFVHKRSLVLIWPLFQFLVCRQSAKPKRAAILFYKKVVPLNFGFCSLGKEYNF